MPIKVDKEYLKTAILPFEMAEKADIPVWITEISDVNPLDISIHDGLKWAVTFHNYLTKALYGGEEPCQHPIMKVSLF